MIEFTATPPIEQELPTIYRAVANPSSAGVSCDGKTLVFGVTLEVAYASTFDYLAEELSQIGADILEYLTLPEEGIIPGKLYYAGAVNIGRDWETNAIDSWDSKIYEWTEPLPVQPEGEQ